MTRTSTLIALIGLAAVARIVPHPPNFAPITAMALLAGASFSNLYLAFIVPLGAMALSDIALELLIRGGVYGHSWLSDGSGLHSGWWVVYATFVVITAIGLLLRKRRSVWTVAAATLFSSVLFFAVTNFAVWAAGVVHPEGAMYEPTLAGLIKCYTLAIPFFNWGTLAGDLIFAGILFGAFALAERRFPSARPAASAA